MTHEIDRLRLACAEEDKRSKAADPKSSFTLDCDPRSLTASDDRMTRKYEQALRTGEFVDYMPVPGVQGEMVRQQRRRLSFLKDKTVPFAVGIAVLSAIPWAWYFFLDRLREVMAVFRS